ncbi:hypothetical protein DXT94_25885 [Rhizobium sp. ICMP 5592]|nr:hypothetical protein [Rhizobium sp. ICMP 5592]
MHFMHIRMRVRPFPLSARKAKHLMFGARMKFTPTAGVVAGLIDNFVKTCQSGQAQNLRFFSHCDNENGESLS